MNSVANWLVGALLGALVGVAIAAVVIIGLCEWIDAARRKYWVRRK